MRRPRPPSEWKVAGQSVPKVDGRAIVTGRHRYASDVERPGMLRGKVLRAPAFGARLASLDTSRADALPDVKVVRDGDFVGVVAPNEHVAVARPRRAAAGVDACRRARRLRSRSRGLSSRRIPTRAGEEEGRVLATATARRRERFGQGRAGGFGTSRSRPLTRSPTSPTHRWSLGPRWPNGRAAS